MRTPGLLTGFLPLIVYGILSGALPGSVQIALLAACIVSLLAGFRLLLRGFILEWVNFLMFTAALFCVSVVHIRTVGEYMSVLIYLVLALVAFGSLLAGVPFTIQYARDMVDRSHWDHPVFRSVNTFMTGVWGALFVVNLVLVLYAMTVTGPAAGVAAITTYAVLVIGIVFTVRYPGVYPGKTARTSGPGTTVMMQRTCGRAGDSGKPHSVQYHKARAFEKKSALVKSLCWNK